MYVSDLIDELKKGKLDVVEGTLYPLLTRLKNGEFLLQMGRIYRRTAQKILSDYRKRKLFLDELQNTWNELTASVNQITQQH
jgi:PadR family transcriptional regulator PadR